MIVSRQTPKTTTFDFPYKLLSNGDLGTKGNSLLQPGFWSAPHIWPHKLLIVTPLPRKDPLQPWISLINKFWSWWVSVKNPVTFLLFQSPALLTLDCSNKTHHFIQNCTHAAICEIFGYCSSLHRLSESTRGLG